MGSGAVWAAKLVDGCATSGLFKLISRPPGADVIPSPLAPCTDGAACRARIIQIRLPASTTHSVMDTGLEITSSTFKLTTLTVLGTTCPKKLAEGPA